jgi:hypothetical protein
MAAARIKKQMVLMRNMIFSPFEMSLMWIRYNKGTWGYPWIAEWTFSRPEVLAWGRQSLSKHFIVNGCSLSFAASPPRVTHPAGAARSAG